MDAFWAGPHHAATSLRVTLTSLLQGWQFWRERRAIARRPIPDDLWQRTLRRYPFLQRRSPADSAQLRRLTSLFLDCKEFTAVGKLRLSNDLVVAIAAQACLPVLHLGLERYSGFVGIVVHADQLLAKREVVDDDGIVHNFDEVLSGEAMAGGPVTLSWRDVRASGQSAREGYNVVIHEFAHVLDMQDGVADGTPILPSHVPVNHWRATLKAEYAALVQSIEAGRTPALDTYGAQSEDEFFAVATEAFFVAPGRLLSEHPALYELFKSYYQQDPASEIS